MSKHILLEVVTPSKIELRKEVEFLVAPTIDGVVGVLPGHVRMITELAMGVLRYQINGVNYYMAVSEGFMEVTPYKVIILAEATELAENIDVKQALEEKRQAEIAVHRPSGEKINLYQAEIELERAITKLEVAKKLGETK